MRFYRARKLDCDVCQLKPHCYPSTEARKVPGACTRTPGTRLARLFQHLNMMPPAESSKKG